MLAFRAAREKSPIAPSLSKAKRSQPAEIVNCQQIVEFIWWFSIPPGCSAIFPNDVPSPGIGSGISDCRRK